ncbi:MAG: glutaredoxin domain-containing protein [Pseudomonadota bacterium]
MSQKSNESGVRPVRVTLYRWAGKWGSFKVKIPCGECALTKDVLLDTFETDLAGIPVELDVRDWLTEWYKPLPKGGWHAPIVLVEGKIISQGYALNRGILTEAVIKEHVAQSKLDGTHLFGKSSCPHCVRAKSYMDAAGIAYEYHDVVKQPRALYEMIARVKPIVGPKTPITVPQIWVDGAYVGGADELGKMLGVLESEPRAQAEQKQTAAVPDLVTAAA